MCNYGEWLYTEGIEKGIEKGHAEMVAAMLNASMPQELISALLMQCNKISLEQAEHFIAKVAAENNVIA